MNKIQRCRGSAAETTMLSQVTAGETPQGNCERILFLEHESEKLRAALREAHEQVDQLSQLADRDPLIEIMNRRAFVRELTRVMSSVERYDFKANLVYVDLNDLKVTNDSFGHAAGDAVLRYIGEMLVSHVRHTDTVGRLGGDEFGILLTHTSASMAELKMDQLAKVIASKPMIWNNRSIDVSISHGVFPLARKQSIDDALHLADQAMYANKRAVRSHKF